MRQYPSTEYFTVVIIPTSTLPATSASSSLKEPCNRSATTTSVIIGLLARKTATINMANTKMASYRRITVDLDAFGPASVIIPVARRRRIRYH